MVRQYMIIAWLATGLYAGLGESEPPYLSLMHRIMAGDYNPEDPSEEYKTFTDRYELHPRKMTLQEFAEFEASVCNSSELLYYSGPTTKPWVLVDEFIKGSLELEDLIMFGISVAFISNHVHHAKLLLLPGPKLDACNKALVKIFRFRKEFYEWHFHREDADAFHNPELRAQFEFVLETKRSVTRPISNYELSLFAPNYYAPAMDPNVVG